MSAPPPSYSDSMQDQGYPAGYNNPQYGAVNPAPPYPGQGAPTYPPQGAPAYPPQGAHGYPPQGAPGYPPQGAPYGHPGNPKAIPSYQYGSQSTTNVVVQPSTQPVVLVGGCPACRVGILEDDFTCCGVLCAILFFPLGVLCCLAMRQRRCAHCGAVFG